MSVTLSVTEEQRQLRRGIRQFLEKSADITTVRREVETEPGHDAATYRRLATELGVVGLCVDEADGGASAGWREQSIALQEAGRTLYPGPLLSTVGLSLPVLSALGEHQLLAAITGGEITVSVAVANAAGFIEVGDSTVTASPDGDSWRLTGERSYVLHGHTADQLIVPARTASGLSLFLADGTAPGSSRRRVPTMDQTRALGTVTMVDSPARLLGESGCGSAQLHAALDFWRLAVASESLGAADRCLEMSVEYAGTREQFGRPIGSFQAVKHMCADVAVTVEAARSSVEFAAWAADVDPDDFRTAAAVAALAAGDALRLASATNVQVHGGIGYTWEHDAHLYLKRATADEHLLGDAAHRSDVLAALVGIG